MLVLRHSWKLPRCYGYRMHPRRALQTVAASSNSIPEFGFAFELSRMPAGLIYHHH
jgi:hypothetical protein